MGSSSTEAGNILELIGVSWAFALRSHYVQTTWPMRTEKEIDCINEFVGFVESIRASYKHWKNGENVEISKICSFVRAQDEANRTCITTFLVDELVLNEFGLKGYSLPILQDLDLPVDSDLGLRLIRAYHTTLITEQHYRDQAITTMMILGIKESRKICLEYINDRVKNEGANAAYPQMVLFLNIDLEEGARLVSEELCVTYAKPRESLGLEYEWALTFLTNWSRRFSNGALEHVIRAIRLREITNPEEVLSTMEYVLCRRSFNVRECDHFRKVAKLV